MEHVTHSFEPVYNEHSKVLILGTFPSVKSREQQFYYGHPQNRFWQLLAAIYREDIPAGIPEKKAFLLRHQIAVWDVIASCEIVGSSDSSIRNVIPNDLSRILRDAPIRQICANGAKAFELYTRHCKPITKIEGCKLPSTSPANAAWSLKRLQAAWEPVIRPC